MADTLRRRFTRPDPWLDEMLEPPERRVQRARARKLCRSLWGLQVTPDLAFGMARALGVSLDTMKASLSLPHFGAAWAEIEACSASLHPRRIRTPHLDRSIAQARMLVKRYAAARGAAPLPGFDAIAAMAAE
jgi:hypothetical protein